MQYSNRTCHGVAVAQPLTSTGMWHINVVG
jgi:hypothetical protein